MAVLIKNAEVEGRRVDVRVANTVVQMGEDLPAEADTVVEARGRALLPGLHDHHIHLYATAVQAQSVDLSTLPAGDREGLRTALRAAPGTDWIRAVGYHEHTAGDLDAQALDALCAHRPVRLQHTSGKLWVLNSPAIERLGLEEQSESGIERNAGGAPTGRLWRMDEWLRQKLRGSPPDLSALSRELASFGVTGVTDASYTNDLSTLDQLVDARQRGALQQKLLVMGDQTLPSGPLKIMLDEDDLPSLAELVEQVSRAHGVGRRVAFHCVSHVELLFALSVLTEAGTGSDRIEHAGVVRPELVPALKTLGVTVVTQPGFIWARGERYRRDADAQDIDHLYPYASLLKAGVPVASSSDAPYGVLDPWRNMAAAVARVTVAGQGLGLKERVAPQEALRGYLSAADAPGGAARQIKVGVPGDLCLLDRSLGEAYQDLAQVKVSHTWIDGETVYVSADNTSSVCSPK